MGWRKSIRTRAEKGLETELGTKEKGWRLEMGGKKFEKRHTDKERRQKDTVSRRGLSQMGVWEMIGGSDLDRGDRGRPTNRVCFDQMTLKEEGRGGGSRKKKVRG